jgi:plastocyanin
MKKIILALFAIALISAADSMAGDLRGRVNGKPGSTVIVWVEGVKRFQVPKSKPSISQQGTRFTPSLLVVVVGQTVNMPNDDNVAHNVFSYSPTKQFNLGIYPKGQSKEVTFTQPGLVDLFCSIHRHMSAKIFVVPNPYYSQTRAGGEYRIAGLPPGKYVVKVWGDGAASQSKAVTVPASGDVSVDF